jgi:hypothetical protein
LGTRNRIIWGNFDLFVIPANAGIQSLDSTLKQQLNLSEGGVEKLAGKARRRVMPGHGEMEQRRQTASPP